MRLIRRQEPFSHSAFDGGVAAGPWRAEGCSLHRYQRHSGSHCHPSCAVACHNHHGQLRARNCVHGVRHDHEFCTRPGPVGSSLRVSLEPTIKAAVTRALREFIARREQRRVAEVFGKLGWDKSFDSKAERTRRR